MNEAYSQAEADDAEMVNQALVEIQADNTRAARELLEIVAVSTPENYCHQYEDEDGINIKFWDEDEFIHFVTRRGQHLERKVNWKPNAYPRAWYYLAFLAVSEGLYDTALDHLKRAERLDPNPRILLERAQILVRAFGDFERALDCYEKVLARGDDCPGSVRASALRGKGYVLIETQDLDGAEACYMESLGLGLHDQSAIRELSYIAHLREGGTPVKSELFKLSNPRACSSCGIELGKGDHCTFENVGGRILYYCSRCSA
jgi:tetratricopeptide (TPR) repeat protein